MLARILERGVDFARNVLVHHVRDVYAVKLGDLLNARQR